MKLKRTFTLLTAVLMLINSNAVNTNAKEEQSFGAFRFKIYSDSVSITGFNSIFSKSLVIPSSINNLPVTSVNACLSAHDAEKWQDVTSITFPEGIKFIGSLVSASFPMLEEVTLPSSLEKIGAYAFEGTRLEEVALPDSLLVIGDFAFAKTKIQKIVIPKNTKSFNNSIILDCPGKEIEISNDNISYKKTADGIYDKSGKTLVQYTGADEKLSLPDSVTDISGYAFYGNTSLKEVSTGESVKFIGNGAFSNSGIKKATIKGKVESTGKDLFADCQNLEFVSIPASVNKLCSGAFSGCDSLSEVVIGGTVYDIEHTAFDKSFKGTVTAPYESAVYRFFEGNDRVKLNLVKSSFDKNAAFARCTEKDNEVYLESYTGSLTELVVPASINTKAVNTISQWAFSGTGIKSVTILPSLKNIGYGAFCGSDIETLKFCGNLGITDIGERAFEGSPLKSVYFDESVKTIGVKAFADTDITQIIIPETVTGIGDLAFAGCTKLQAVYFEGDAPEMGTAVFENCDPDLKIYYGKNTKGFEDVFPGQQTNYITSLAYDGDKADFKTYPVNLSGTVMLPAKEVFEKFGYKVLWNGADGINGSVTVSKENESIKLFIGSTYAEINGRETSLNAAPVTINGTSYVPARAAAGFLGMKIFWNSKHETVEFNS